MGGKIKLYHGTCGKAASSILKTEIDFTRGGGELGQGFYMSTSLAYASCMAWHKMKYERDSQFVVLSAAIDVDDIKNWSVKSFSSSTVQKYWREFRRTNKTKIHQFGVDLVVSPIQDGMNMGSWQFKFESPTNPVLSLKDVKDDE